MLLPPSVRVYLALDPVDMRCGHDGLAAIVRTQWKRDLYSGHLFVFTGKRGDRIKILFWDRGGFVLYYKRLERGRFRLPRVRPGATEVELAADELGMVLSGIDLDRVERPQLWTPRHLPAPADTNRVDT